jgi:hypothetical protein
LWKSEKIGRRLLGAIIEFIGVLNRALLLTELGLIRILPKGSRASPYILRGHVVQVGLVVVYMVYAPGT